MKALLIAWMAITAAILWWPTHQPRFEARWVPQGQCAAVVLQMEWPRHAVSGELALQSVRGAGGRAIGRGSECHRDTSMQQHLPFFGLHTLAKLPHCKLSPPHLRWLLAAPACGAIDSNISAADSVTISIRMIWLPVRSPNGTAI